MPIFVDDTTVLPFPSKADDWFTVLTPTYTTPSVYVENALIIQVMKLDGKSVIENPKSWTHNLSIEYRNYAVFIGESIARVIQNTKFDVPENTSREFKFSKIDIDLRFGRFGNNVFVFLPRPEVEALATLRDG